jgi:gamma-glutamyltranspeptidase / glutathione hydrolase
MPRRWQRIAGDGPDALYQGDIAQGIVDAVAGAWANPGDLAPRTSPQYRRSSAPAVCAPYRGHRVCGMGPPSSGGLTVQMTLAMLEGFDLGDGPSPGALHLIGEALGLAFADRARYIADPDFVAVPDGLLDPGYLAERAALIDAAAAGGPFAPGDPPRRAGERATTRPARAAAPARSRFSTTPGQRGVHDHNHRIGLRRRG